jgi:hypothetical protein
MSPTPQELELGAKAYRQLRFYENVAVKDIRQSPWLFAIFGGLLLIAVFIIQVPPRSLAQKSTASFSHSRVFCHSTMAKPLGTDELRHA